MRKMFLLPFVALLLCCSNDDGEKNEEESNLFGRWFMESTTVNGVKIPEENFDCEVNKEFYLEFTANLGFTVFNYYECQDELQSGSYEVSNNNIVVILDGETFIYEIVVLTKDRLALKYLEDDNDDGIPETVVFTLYK